MHSDHEGIAKVYIYPLYVVFSVKIKPWTTPVDLGDGIGGKVEATERKPKLPFLI